MSLDSRAEKCFFLFRRVQAFHFFADTKKTFSFFTYGSTLKPHPFLDQSDKIIIKLILKRSYFVTNFKKSQMDRKKA
jgi:hypothetical protein